MDADRDGICYARIYANALLSYLREPPYALTRFGESVTLEHASVSTASGSS